MNNHLKNNKVTKLSKSLLNKKPLSTRHHSKQVDEEIKALKQQIEFILGATQTGLDIIDSNFNVLYIDPEWSRIYGDPKGKKCYEYFMDRTEHCPKCGIIEALRKKKPVVREEILMKENNRPIQVTTIPFQNEKGEWLVAEVNVDISERKRAEEALRQAYEEMETRVQERTNELARANEALQADIMKRKQTEEALRKSEERYRALAELAQDFIFIVDRQGSVQYVNRSGAKEFGCRLDEMLGRNIKDLFPPGISERQKNNIQKVIETGTPLNIEHFTKFPNRALWFNTDLIPLKDERGQANSVLGISRDITERKHAEEALRESEEKYRLLIENANEAILVAQDGMLKFANPKSSEIIGYSKEELGSRPFTEFIHPEDRGIVGERYLKRLKGEPIPDVYPFRVIDKQGNIKWVEINAILIHWEDRPATLNFLNDITERKKIEEALKESEEKYRTILENIEDGYYETDLPGNLTFFNDSLCRMLGYSKDEMMGMGNKQYTDEENRKKLFQAFNEVYRTGEPVKGFDWEVIRKDGAKVFGEVSVSLIKDSEGQPTGFRGIARDVTERKQSENALQAEKQRFQLLLENAPFGMILIDKDGMFKYINPKFTELFGYDLKDAPHGREWFRKAYPDPAYRHQVIATWIDDLKSSEPGEKIPRIFTVTCKDGTEKIIRFITVQLESGECLESAEDITLLKRAEEEKAALAEQLRQSQRMEAIGRLAGGVAHDFNNLLTVIRGYSQLTLLELKEGDKLWGNIEEIQKATKRATELTQQLLAFSRRQIMDMKILDLNTLLQDLDKMLHRVIGEDIELVYRLAKDLGKVKIDPGQMEQVILNLAINSRDAMPGGGRLIIETKNMEIGKDFTSTHIGMAPGHYVMFSVSDTGVGMTPTVRERVFEPFFTTKEKSKGTGLGLSTVYGIVKQSRGNIWVYSEPGRGTLFKIYLPRVDESLKEIEEKVETIEILRGSETILAVEDEEEVRTLVVRILREQGYTVIAAAHGEEAMRLAEEHRGNGIHLLLTDVVMPGMSGRELAEGLKLRYPGIKVLYMSGYTDDAIVHHGVIEEGINYIQKPFTLDSLARKLREVLDH
jgi:two-component system cell cycle sensor histidine kinase/response regulator CckA